MQITDNTAWRISGGLSKVSERLQSHAAWRCCGGKLQEGSEEGSLGRLLPAPPLGAPQRPLAAAAAARPGALLRRTLHGCAPRGGATALFKYHGDLFACHQDGRPSDWPVQEQPPTAGPCAHGGGGANREMGGDTAFICIAARRVRRGEAALAPGAGSEFESTAAAAAAGAGAAAGREGAGTEIGRAHV